MAFGEKDVADFMPCKECGFDHSYEYLDAFRAHFDSGIHMNRRESDSGTVGNGSTLFHTLASSTRNERTRTGNSSVG
jgi:hypothetical protein